MRKDAFSERLAALNRLARDPSSPTTVKELRDAIRGNSGPLAAAAASIVGRCRIADLAPELVAAFERALTEKDKQCQVKTAVASALAEMDYPADEVYLRGIRHVQMEPVFGGHADAAADLRAQCAVALTNQRHPEVALCLARLLADPETGPRRTAVRALGCGGIPEAECLLQLKALVGDEEPEITGECLNSLLTLSPDRSIEFVGEFLESPHPELAEQAALALGQTHDARAFELMRSRWEDNPSPSFRQMLLLPMSLLRLDPAFDFLVEVVRGGGRMGAAAVRALGLYRDDYSLRRLRQAIEAKSDPLLDEAFAREFGNA